jgi:hypothetical protein
VYKYIDNKICIHEIEAASSLGMDFSTFRKERLRGNLVFDPKVHYGPKSTIGFLYFSLDSLEEAAKTIGKEKELKEFLECYNLHDYKRNEQNSQSRKLRLNERKKSGKYA